ncbi:MAG: protein phosphatase 2C domain-containing protein [Pseudomonadota bacterium]
MPQRSDTTRFEAASALIQGGRDHQEDAVVTDFPLGSDLGLVVLSDGMGGHAAGDIASKIVMTEVYSELKFQSTDPAAFAAHLPDILRNAALSANDCVRAHIEENPSAYGMGATLVAATLLGDQLNWISVGDSPLYVFRSGELKQVNEDHSMAPQIDLMVTSGMMSADAAVNHPDRNALTSVLAGDEIPKIDCPRAGMTLLHGDIVLAASDGLQFLEDDEIRGVLECDCDKSSATIARHFLAKLDELGDPDQDNTSLAVIKIEIASADETPVDLNQDALGLEESAWVGYGSADVSDAGAWQTEAAIIDDVAVETLPIRRAVTDQEPADPQVRPRRVVFESDRKSARPKKAKAKT